MSPGLMLLSVAMDRIHCDHQLAVEDNVSKCIGLFNVTMLTLARNDDLIYLFLNGLRYNFTTPDKSNSR
jgi:hypothetical protein